MAKTQYTMKEFESFAKAIRSMASYVRSQGPNYIFAPVMGSVPLVDALVAVDRKFPAEIVEYPPNSSRFDNREELMSRWYGNFLRSNYNGEPMKIVCIDEVISGSSAMKGNSEFQKALENFANERESPRIKRKVNYLMAAVGEQPDNGRRNSGVSSLQNNKKLRIFETNRILTCDNMDFNPIRLKVKETTKTGNHIYAPVITKFEVTPKYVALLTNLAKHVGRDPAHITIQNVAKIQDSVDRYNID